MYDMDEDSAAECTGRSLQNHGVLIDAIRINPLRANKASNHYNLLLIVLNLKLLRVDRIG